jgi:hypothetical protein
VEVRQAAEQSIADLNRNCSADGIHQPQRFGARLIAWQEITLKASNGTLKHNKAFLQVSDKLPLLFIQPTYQDCHILIL